MRSPRAAAALSSAMAAEPFAPAQLDSPHLLTAAEVAARLNVDPDEGLADDDVAARRARHGRNRLPEAARRSWPSRILGPFRDFMIVVLLAAAVLSGVIGDRIDTIAILVIVLLNAVIAIAQEWRADRALEALQKMAPPHGRRCGAVVGEAGGGRGQPGARRRGAARSRQPRAGRPAAA